MSKIIQITTGALYGGDASHVLYALTDDGRIFWQRSDASEWKENDLPNMGNIPAEEENRQ